MPGTLSEYNRFVESPVSGFDYKSDRWGVLFLNMGGPETLDDIKEYLYNIFSDRTIIKLPLSSLMQKPLARFISSRRTPKVQEHYRMIGGGSPLLKWSKAIADGVETSLAEKYPKVMAFVGMRYTAPFIQNELDRAVESGCKHILIVPFYPHYSLVTTGTALNEVDEWLRKNNNRASISIIPDWHDKPGYIDLLKTKISDAMRKAADKNKARLVFSAHSLPLKIVEQGDPYVGQVRRTAALAGEGYDYILAFQSRTGPVKWQGPDTVDIVKKLGTEGVKELVIVPISFVSDHIETLHEIDIEMKATAKEAGIDYIKVVNAPERKITIFAVDPPHDTKHISIICIFIDTF